MKKLSIFLACIVCFSCAGKKQDEVQEKFDSKKWAMEKDGAYPYRVDMLNDFMNSYEIHGIKMDSVVKLLGQPNRTDSGYLFYTVSQERAGFLPLHTTTLVIKLKSDSTVEWRKIHR